MLVTKDPIFPLLSEIFYEVGQIWIVRPHVLIDGDIREKGVTYLRITVPVEHGVDSLRQLGATGLVNAGRVNPDVAVTVLAGDLARLPDLLGESGVRIPDGAE